MTMTSRSAGICYFKVDGEQLSLTGGIEVSMNTIIRDDIIGLTGDVHYKETRRAPYIKGTFKVSRQFPLKKIMETDDMAITAELANGTVFVMVNSWVHGEVNYNADEGTADIEFHGQRGDFQ